MGKLVVFGEDWASHPSSTQHLMPYIAEDFDVVWINSIGLRKPSFSVKDLKRVWQKLRAKLFGGRRPSNRAAAPPFPVVNPLVIPLSSSFFGRWLNRRLLAAQVRPLLKQGEEVWVWSSLPSAIDYHGLFGEIRWLYYCGDDFSALAGVDHEQVRPREKQMIEQASHIWVASDELKQRLAEAENRITVIEHGVDVQKFSSNSERPQEVPANMPILGFYGAIADWIDQDLLIDIATQLPHWQLMLIGPQLVDVSRLQKLPNVLLLPPKPHEALPSYLQHWQAAILPFKDCTQIRACNPLKLREYLASGTPVLSVNFPALKPYRDLVCVITDGGDAASALERIPETENQQRRFQRQQSMMGESWSVRADIIRQQLQDCRADVL